MSTIPSYQPVRSPGTDRTQPIVRAPETGMVDGISDLSKSMKEQAEIRDTDELAKARIKYNLVKAEQDSAFDAREDYDAFDQEYTGVMKEAEAAAATGITNARVRDLFMDEVGLKTEQGRQRIKGIARTKYNDQETATILEEMDILQRTAVNNDATDVGEVYQAVGARIDAAVAKDVFPYEAGEKMKQAWRDEAAETKIRGMADPRDRIKALQTDWAQYIPAHIRKDITDKAEAQLRDIVFQTVDSGVGRFAGRRAIYEKYRNDSLKMTDAMAEYDKAYSINLMQETEEQNDIFSKHYTNVGYGAYTLDQIKDPKNPEERREWERLTPSMQNALEQLERSRMAGTVPSSSDRGVFMTLNQMMVGVQGGAVKKAEFDRYFMENVHLLSDTDFKMFDEFRVGDAEGILSAATLLQGILQDPLLSADKKNRVRSRLTQWFFREKERLGTPPSEQDIANRIQTEMEELPGTGFIFNDTLQELDEIETMVDSYLDPNTTNDQRKVIRTSAFQAFPLQAPEDVDAVFDLKVFQRAQPEDFEDFKRLLREKKGIIYENVKSVQQRRDYLRMYIDAAQQ